MGIAPSHAGDVRWARRGSQCHSPFPCLSLWVPQLFPYGGHGLGHRSCEQSGSSLSSPGWMGAWMGSGHAGLRAAPLPSPLADADEAAGGGSAFARDKPASTPKPIGTGTVTLPWTLLRSCRAARTVGTSSHAFLRGSVSPGADVPSVPLTSLCPARSARGRSAGEREGAENSGLRPRHAELPHPGPGAERVQGAADRDVSSAGAGAEGRAWTWLDMLSWAWYLLREACLRGASHPSSGLDLSCHG